MKLVKILCSGLLGLSLVGCAANEEPPVQEPPKVEEKLEIVENDIYESPDASKVNNAMIRAFNQLSQDLVDENVEMSQIAKDVVTCFAYDFFTFKGKVDQSDIGGLTYLPNDQTEEFASFAAVTFYKNYEKIINEFGEGSLLEVTQVDVTNVTEQTVTYQYNEYDGFVVEANLTYADTKVDQTTLKTTIQATCIDLFNGIIVITEVK